MSWEGEINLWIRIREIGGEVPEEELIGTEKSWWINQILLSYIKESDPLTAGLKDFKCMTIIWNNKQWKKT